MTATGQAKYQKNLGGLVPDIVHIPFNDIDSLKKELDETACGVLLEPVQGEGGILPADPAYLAQVRALCDERDVLLLFDEVQCGMGRTGELFAFEAFGVKPDGVCLAKGLGTGFPIGALLANEKAQKAFEPGNHASTFGGNALACTAACEVLRALTQDGVLENVKKQGELLKSGLKSLMEKYPFVKDVRGMGLMLGMELEFPVREVIAKAIENGLLLVNAGENILRFVPPLIVSGDDVTRALRILDEVFTSL